MVTSVAMAIMLLLSRGLSYHVRGNLAMLGWTNGLLAPTAGERSAAVPNGSVPTGDQSLGRLPESVSAAFGRVSLAQGDYQSAARFFAETVDLTAGNPILLAETLIAFSRAEQFERVIALYEAHAQGPLASREANEAVALAYLQRLEAGGAPEPAALGEMLETVARLVPADLYVQYLLRTSAGLKLDRETFADFPITAVSPADERLLAYTARLVPQLVQDGIWDEARLERLLRFWVWQYADSAALADLITQLADLDGEGDLRDLLTEMDARSRVDSGSETAVVDATNLLHNPGFEDLNGGYPAGWKTADYVTGPDAARPQAAFFVGTEDFARTGGAASLRIDGLWKANDSGFFGAVSVPAVAQGTYYLAIEPGIPYTISGRYRTRGDAEKASVYAGNPQRRLAEVWLPATSDQWELFEHTACITGDSAEDMQFLLRLWNEGTVWFDDLAVRRVDAASPSVSCQ